MTTENTNPEPPQLNTQDVILGILASAEEHAEITATFTENFVFYEKSLAEWGCHLAIEIPKEATPDKIKPLYLELLRKLQQCTVLYTRANSVFHAISDGSSSKKKDLVTGLVQMYADTKGKRPAATVLDSMAESYLNTGEAKIAARIVKDFFKDQKDTLTEARKALEQLGFLMHLELKLGEHM